VVRRKRSETSTSGKKTKKKEKTTPVLIWGGKAELNKCEKMEEGGQQKRVLNEGKSGRGGGPTSDSVKKRRRNEKAEEPCEKENFI